MIRQHEGSEVTLRMPGESFEDLRDRRSGFRDTALLFAVGIGTFEPVTRREGGAHNRQGISNRMPFVAAGNLPLPRMAAIAAEPLRIPSPPVTTCAMRPGEHGLARLDTPHASDKADLREDVSIRPAGHRAMTTAVSRTSPPTPPSRNPRCRQGFRAADRDLRLSCDRTEPPIGAGSGTGSPQS